MAFIWNKKIFKKAGLDPEKPPATWADVVKYSAQIKKTTGKAGYGMVARVNAGNTPFRVMPDAVGVRQRRAGRGRSPSPPIRRC